MLGVRVEERLRVEVLEELGICQLRGHREARFGE